MSLGHTARAGPRWQAGVFPTRRTGLCAGHGLWGSRARLPDLPRHLLLSVGWSQTAMILPLQRQPRLHPSPGLRAVKARGARGVGAPIGSGSERCRFRKEGARVRGFQSRAVVSPQVSVPVGPLPLAPKPCGRLGGRAGCAGAQFRG